MMDLKIKNEREEFHCRSCGVIKQNNKFLIMRVNRSEYYHIPGGHIELGETSKDAVIREIKEEVGCIHTIQGYDLNYIGIIIHLYYTVIIVKSQHNLIIFRKMIKLCVKTE
ncbi:MAG: NUDIX domain-containing protein [Clostridia bacterium]|nr:NUDIX domain-containing protein [Clostridia bacterium]